MRARTTASIEPLERKSNGSRQQNHSTLRSLLFSFMDSAEPPYFPLFKNEKQPLTPDTLVVIGVNFHKVGVGFFYLFPPLYPALHGCLTFQARAEWTGFQDFPEVPSIFLIQKKTSPSTRLPYNPWL